MDILGRLRHVCGEEIVKVSVLLCILLLSCLLRNHWCFNHVNDLLFSVSSRYSGHSVFHFGWQHRQIWTTGVSVSGEIYHNNGPNAYISLLTSSFIKTHIYRTSVRVHVLKHTWFITFRSVFVCVLGLKNERFLLAWIQALLGVHSCLMVPSPESL